jgi:L-threonylcarbamoyladenylate synthase
MTIVLPSKDSIQLATNTLLSGGAVAFATETVYGLGCDTFNKDAIQQVYSLKGRPRDNPMIAHVLDQSWADKLTEGWSETCARLAEAFWPGPLTIVLPRRSDVPPDACGGRDTVAIRCPDHVVAQELLQGFGSPISAPSANKSGYVSPTTAQHVADEFGDSILILDGGSCVEGIESTVISLVTTPSILRPGTIPIQVIEEVIGPVTEPTHELQTDSPGTTTRHYSPRAMAVLVSTDEMNALNDGTSVALVLSGTPKTSKYSFQMPENPKEYGALLYHVLREADSSGAVQIAIEQPPQTIDWHTVQDRLMRCAAKN